MDILPPRDTTTGGSGARGAMVASVKWNEVSLNSTWTKQLIMNSDSKVHGTSIGYTQDIWAQCGPYLGAMHLRSTSITHQSNTLESDRCLTEINWEGLCYQGILLSENTIFISMFFFIKEKIQLVLDAMLVRILVSILTCSIRLV